MFSCICIRTILTFLSQYVNKMVTAEYGTSSMGVDMQHLLSRSPAVCQTYFISLLFCAIINLFEQYVLFYFTCSGHLCAAVGFYIIKTGING